MKEHYRIILPESAARKTTLFHAQKITACPDLVKHPTIKPDTVIAECDGTMVPIVETSTSKVSPDRRKHKQLFWKEARLSLAHAKGSTEVCFAGTMGSVNITGQQLLSCVEQTGAHKDTYVHCVGDGARWIANQVEEQFGANGRYLIDFYHLCEYLTAAAKSCAPESEASWLHRQKKLLKLNKHQEVLNALRPHIEPRDIEEQHAPVRACYRYIKNRPEQLDYETAISEELPIGSGEVESAHRYVIQARLKLAGAWWKIQNAQHMIGLRVCRANELWDEYWAKAA